jgi:pyruvate dehydrogenase E1 component
VDTQAWVATSYQQLHREGLDVERWNRMHPDSGPRVSHTEACLGQEADGLVVATSDYMKTLPCSIRPWIAGTFVGLGTDGFGRSDCRASLRDYFEVDARHIAFATLEALFRMKKFTGKKLQAAMKDLGIDADKPDPTAI